MLTIHNSLSRSKQPFEPIEPGKVRMYVCGMTVYDYCHLGHARALVVFDVITRYLRWSGYDVDYVRNITDIDDKIIARANENGEDFRDLTARFIAAMHEDCHNLGVLPPDHEPRATDAVDGMLAMITTLIDNGHAYVADNGDVYYDVSHFPDYGKLSGKKIDDLRAGARVEIAEAKDDPLDFALWKAAKPGEPSWDSPWGPGRPGWHIECSVMSTAALGNHFDIHGGGRDLQFPHHENEIAQSEGATGEPFANYWVHNGFVRIADEKMSKSLGNFLTIREILERYRAEEVRYFIVNSHYRSPLNYSEEALTPRCATCRKTTASTRPTRRASPRRWTTTSTPPKRLRCCSSWRARSIAPVRRSLRGPRSLATPCAPSAVCLACCRTTRSRSCRRGPERVTASTTPRSRRRSRRATRRARTAISPPPTASATSSRRPASSSRTGPAAPAGGAPEPSFPLWFGCRAEARPTPTANASLLQVGLRSDKASDVGLNPDLPQK
jgi:cysteinyl-tRNA synthetase